MVTPSGEKAPVFDHGPAFEQRMAAIELLGRRRDHASAPALVNDLADPDPAIRAQAAKALGRVRAPDGVPALRAALKDRDDTVRASAAQALAQHSGAALQPATEALGAALADPTAGHADALAAALAKIPTARAAALLFTTLAKRQDGNAMNQVVQRYQRVPPGPYAVDALRAAMTSPGFPQVHRVVRWLGAIGDAKALPALLEAAKSPEAPMRAAAAQALGRFPQDARVPTVLRGLAKDADASVRASALDSLGRLGLAADTALLRQALADADRSVRATAAQRLGERPGPGSAAALVPLLADTQDYVAYTAARALGALHDLTVLPALGAKLKALPAEKQLPMRTVLGPLLPWTPEEMRARLVEYATLPEHGSRRRTELLNYFVSTPACRDTVLAALAADQPATLRLGALRAEQALLDPRAVPLLIAALEDADPALRDAAVRTLATAREDTYGQDEHLGMRLTRRRAHLWYSGRGPERPWLRAESQFADPRLVAPLIARAKALDLTGPLEPNRFTPDARRDVIRLLGWTGDPRAADALAALLNAPEPNVRREAALALAACDDPRAAEPLLQTLRASSGTEIEAAVAMGLSRMRDPAVRDALAEIGLTHAQPKVRQAACLALGFSDDARALDTLIEIMVGNPRPEVREFAAFALGQLADTGAVDALANALRDPVEYARSAAAGALGQIGDPAAIMPLAQASADTNIRFRRRVGLALAQLGDRRGYTLQGEVVLGSEPQYAYFAAKALAELSDALAVDMLCPALDIEHAYLRFPDLVVKGLGQIGGRRAGQVLLDLLEDDRHWTLDIPEALAATGDARANDVILARLRAPEAQGFYHAVAAAALTGDPRMIPPLAAAIAPDRPHVACALLRLGSDRALDQVLALLRQHPINYADVLSDAARHHWPVATRQRMVDALAAHLDERPAVRVPVAQALLAFGDPRGGAALLALYRQFPRGATHEDAGTALEALDPAVDAGVQQALLAWLPETRGAQREDLIYLLGAVAARHPDAAALREIVPQFIADLDDADPRLREAAARTLGALGDVRAVPALLERVPDPASRVREQAILALGRTPDPRRRAVVPLIARLSDEPSPRLARTAAAALEALTGQHFGEDAAQWTAWWQQQ